MSLSSYFYQKARSGGGGGGLGRGRSRSSPLDDLVSAARGLDALSSSYDGGSLSLSSAPLFALSNPRSSSASAAAVTRSRSVLRSERSSLYDLVRCRDWDAASVRARSHRHEVRLGWRYRYAMTALHWTCCNDPPLYFVRTVVEVCPEALIALDGDGNPPLHVACMWDAAVEVVAFLIERGREYCAEKIIGYDGGEAFDPVRRRNRSGMTALHLACQSSPSSESPTVARPHPSADVVRVVVVAHPESVLVRDSDGGMTPLHLACRDAGGAGAIRALLEAAEAPPPPPRRLRRRRQQRTTGGTEEGKLLLPLRRALLTRDRKGRTPSQLLFRHFEGTVRDCLRQANDSTGEGENDPVDRRDIAVSVVEEDVNIRLCVETIALFARCARQHVAVVPSSPHGGKGSVVVHPSSAGPPPSSPLHNVSAAGEDVCPVPIFRLLMLLHPDEVGTADGDGKLPLHLACGNGNWGSSGGSAAFVPPLIGANSGAARVVDGVGRLPLHVGAASGLPWEVRRRRREDDGNDQDSYLDGDNSLSGEGEREGCLRLLFEVEPRAVTARDPMTGLYPFALAACGISSEESAVAELETATDEHVVGFEACLSQKAEGGGVDGRLGGEEEVESPDCDSVLTVTYELLRVEPSVLGVMLRMSQEQ